MSATATRADNRRGTKRTCLNDECSRRFYDLNRAETDCPHCGTLFVVPPPMTVDPLAYTPRQRVKQYKITQSPAETFDRAIDENLPPVDLEEASTAGPAADDIPEIEDDEELIEEAIEIEEPESN